MPKPTRLQNVVVLVILSLATVHVLSVTVAAVPTNSVSTNLRATTNYLNPFFTQNWRLFAPNPIADDRTFWVRGRYTGDSGETKETDWFDWSAVELDLIRHKIVGGRAGYVTNKLIGPLSSTFRGLTANQRKLLNDDEKAALAGYQSLRNSLLKLANNPVTVSRWLRYETSATRLATDVLQATHPDTAFTAVQYRIGRQPVVSYENRGLSQAEQEKNRISISFFVAGWRKPIEGSKAEKASVASFLARHG